MNVLIVSAGCAFVTAGALLIAGRAARQHGLQHVPVFRVISAVWFGRYALSLLANATGNDALGLASEHWVILAANASMALCALLTLPEWRSA